MTSQIIPTNPTAGSATTSSVRENFRIADEEITQLQRSNIDAQDLTGGPIAYSVTYPSDPAFTLVDGVRIVVRVNVTNTSLVTELNVNGTGSTPVKSLDGKTLTIGELVPNQYYELMLNAVVPGSPYWACLNINKGIIGVEGAALGNTTGDEVTQAEFTSINANKSTLAIKDERWADGTDWLSASKALQFEIDGTPHAYIASSTEGSGTRGIEIGTHNSEGAKEKFFVGDADAAAYLFHDNVKKFQTVSNGILVTGGDQYTSIVFEQNTDGPHPVATDLCRIQATWNENETSASFLDFMVADDDLDGFRFRFKHYENGVDTYEDFMTLKVDTAITSNDKGILSVAGKANFENQITLTANNIQASAQPKIVLRSNEPSAPAGNLLGQIEFQGHNSSEIDITYGYIQAAATTKTTGEEDGKIGFFVQNNSTFTQVLKVQHNGIKATSYMSSDGSEGVTGTASSSSTLTVKNGLIVAIV
tara:strand:+ start:995 stop:2422 length:1428 start_codon:yes stop_codon:yes gene_type:complete